MPLHVRAGRAGDPEIEDLRLAGVRHEHVRRLEIAVDDPALVRVLHRIGELDDEPDAVGDRQPLRSRVVGHRRAGDQLHHEMRRSRAVARR